MDGASSAVQVVIGSLRAAYRTPASGTLIKVRLATRRRHDCRCEVNCWMTVRGAARVAISREHIDARLALSDSSRRCNQHCISMFLVNNLTACSGPAMTHRVCASPAKVMSTPFPLRLDFEALLSSKGVREKASVCAKSERRD